MRKYFSLIILILALAACNAATPAVAPAPTGPAPTPRPTVPLAPTSTPDPQSLPALAGVRPVTLVTSDGIPLRGDYYSPQAANIPAVLLVHGSGHTRDDWQFLAQLLMMQDMAVMTIDLRGYGGSGGRMEDQHKTEDVAAAIDFLAAQAQVDDARLIIVGENDGSWWTLDYASKHPEIKGVALITPGISYDKKFLKQVMSAYGSRPIFIAVSDNEGVHDENAVKTAKLLNKLASGPHRLLVRSEYGWGIGLLMQEKGLIADFLPWMKEMAGN